MNKNKTPTLSEDYIAGFTDGEGCFDLQFRRDVRHERLNKPAYYAWKCQFVIVARDDDEELMRKIRDKLGRGSINFSRGDQVRYSVQDIDSLYDIIVPFFRKYPLSGKKNKDFELWAEAIEIIRRNKRKTMNVKTGFKGFTKTSWNKQDFLRLIEIQKLMQEYKSKRPQGFKWVSVAESIAKTLK
ncbi:MAG: LAGLIDADG family homing endonuclease [Candidatus Paceibacterota bacterium]